MSKTQFINRYGTDVTVTRLDGTSYNTRMLYKREVHNQGVLGTSFLVSMEYMRGGVFGPYDDINDGYIVTVNDTGEEMFIGAHQYEVKNGKLHSILVDMYLLYFPTQVQVTPSQAAQDVQRDIYGEPTSTVQPRTIGIMITQAELDIRPEVGGGQPVEILYFYTRSGSIDVDDELTWNGNTFRTISVMPFGIAGYTQMDYCKAQRVIGT